MWHSDNLHLQLQLQEKSRGSLTEKEKAGKISVYGKKEKIKARFMCYIWEGNSAQIVGHTLF